MKNPYLYLMNKLLKGIFLVALLSIFFLWSVVALAWIALKLAISIVIFMFMAYVLYVLWGAYWEIRESKNKKNNND